ncbi:MAG: hypothetical protein ACI9BW_004290 [Gammaproteobacteria bacterium]|jgi:hypothetical protein
MDERPPAIHRFAARCVRPDRAAPRSVNPLRGFSSPALPANKNTAHWAVLMLVEVVGIEPTSARPTLRDLHAYSVFNLTVGYPTGRENSQPVQ